MAGLPVRSSLPQWLAAVAFALTLAGCSVRGAAPASTVVQTGNEVTGVWEGLAADDCSLRKVSRAQCAGVVHVALTLIQQGSSVSGFYKCAAGTVNCQREEEGGRLACGRIVARRVTFRVMLPDGGSCMYQALRSGEAMLVSYFCLGGEIIMARGWFTIERSY